MNYRKITAIFPSILLEEMERALERKGVPGMTVTRVRGLGDYRNFYTEDNLVDCARIEIFTTVEEAPRITAVIREMVEEKVGGGALVAVLPVEELLHLHGGEAVG